MGQTNAELKSRAMDELMAGVAVIAGAKVERINADSSRVIFPSGLVYVLRIEHVPTNMFDQVVTDVVPQERTYPLGGCDCETCEAGFNGVTQPPAAQEVTNPCEECGTPVRAPYQRHRECPTEAPLTPAQVLRLKVNSQYGKEAQPAQEVSPQEVQNPYGIHVNRCKPGCDCNEE